MGKKMFFDILVMNYGKLLRIIEMVINTKCKKQKIYIKNK